MIHNRKIGCLQTRHDRLGWYFVIVKDKEVYMRVELIIAVVSALAIA